MFINTSASTIASIATAGASWTATEDCYCIAMLGAATSAQATVYLDGTPMVVTSVATSSSIKFTHGGGFYVKKGQVVSTKSGSHVYLLQFVPLF